MTRAGITRRSTLVTHKWPESPKTWRGMRECCFDWSTGCFGANRGSRNQALCVNVTLAPRTRVVRLKLIIEAYEIVKKINFFAPNVPKILLDFGIFKSSFYVVSKH